MTVVRSYLDVMPIVPAARPDSAKILQLIKDRGYRSIAEFARSQRRMSVSTLYNVCHSGQRASLDYFDRLAAALSDGEHHVEADDLILSGDDSEDEQRAPALAS